MIWTDKTAKEATGGELKGTAWQAARVEIDSRRVRPGDLFIALKGENFDGHEFVGKAFAAGAVAAVVARPPLEGGQNFLKEIQGGYQKLAERKYDEPVLDHAKKLRQNSTEAERILWGYIKGKKLERYKFRRQQPMGPYIADFYCAAAKLVIELDGSQHGEEKNIAYDTERTAFMEKAGYRVLRFWNNEVLQNIADVGDKILEALVTPPDFSKEKSALPQGEGGSGGTIALQAMADTQGGDGNLLLVQDVQKGLEALAAYSRKRTKAKIIGLTGSVGKTSTKEMLRLALAPHGKVFASHGNFNNHIGAPLNLANLPLDADFAVFEMGMNHAGEISALTQMVRPEVAIITNVEAVHLEFFESVEGIADAKAEIFEGLVKGGTAILNAENAHFARLKKSAPQKMIACGMDVKLLEYSSNACGSAVKASVFGKEFSYVLGAIGKHWATTSLFALATAHALGLDVKKSAEALAGFSEPEGRGRPIRIRVNGGEALLIDDSYNASPASMRAAFAKTVEYWNAAGKQGRKIAALGDMLELGAETETLHRSLANDLQEFDAVFTAGKHMRALHEALPQPQRGGHVEKAQGLLPLLQKSLRANDVLLVKGSHGSKMYELINPVSAGGAAQDLKRGA